MVYRKPVKLVSKQSKKRSLNEYDAQKLMTGALIAVSGALLTYVTQIITDTDFGSYTPLLVASWSVIVNTIRKFLKGWE